MGKTLIEMRMLVFVVSCLALVSCKNNTNSETIEGNSSAAIQNAAGPNLYDLGVYVSDVVRSKEFYTSVFGLEVVREWQSIDLSYDDENYMTGELHGLYLSGNNGMHLELIQKGEPEKRQEVQQPINHFAIKVDDVREVYAKAVSMGAKPAFDDDRLQYARIGDFKVLNTQIIGLDGERIQIIQVLNE